MAFLGCCTISRAEFAAPMLEGRPEAFCFTASKEPASELSPKKVGNSL